MLLTDTVTVNREDLAAVVRLLQHEAFAPNDVGVRAARAFRQLAAIVDREAPAFAVVVELEDGQVPA